MKNQIVEGVSAEDLLAGNQRIEDKVTIKRTDAGKVDPMIIEAAFQMPYPQKDKPSVQVVNLSSGDIVVVLLDKVTTPAEIAQDQKNAVKQQRSNDIANTEFEYVITTIKDAAEIERNTDLLQ